MRRLPLAAYVPMGVTSRYAAPKATVDPDRSKKWIKRAAPIVLAHKVQFFSALIFSFLGLIIQVWIPKILQNGITNSLINKTQPLHNYVELIAVLGLFTGVFGYISRTNLFKVAYAIEFDLRNILYEHFTRMSFPFYDRVQSGQLISRANSDIRSVQMYLTFAPMILVQCSIAVVAFAFMLSISVPLAFVAMASMPFIYIVGVKMRKSLFPVSWIIQARLAEVATVVDENVNGVRVVRSFAAEQQQLRQLATAADRVQWAYIKDADLRARFAPLVQNLSQVGLVLVLLVGGWMVIHEHLPVASIVSFNLYLVMMQAPFMMLGMLIMMGQRASASAERIYEILDEVPTIVDRPDAVDLVDSSGDVEFDGVSFAYADDSLLSKEGDGPREILRDFNLHLHPGETIALVGRTGSGKSTVARVLARFYDATGGTVRVDGHDVRDLTLTSLRANIGVVLDEPFLFSVSIRDNIAYGRPDASLEEVVAAAEAAGAAGFIKRLSDGYDTVVGERGYTLSGGQRQRIAIARALLVNPPILILDDATSAIDVKVEQRIHSSLPRPHGGAHHAHHRPPVVHHQPGRPGRAARRGPHRGGRHPRRAARLDAALCRGARPGGQRGADGRGGRGRHRGPRAGRRRPRARGRRPLMFGGGGVGPPMGGGGAPGAAQAGLPFGGIPHELQDGVDVLLAQEGERGESDAVFTQLPSSHESKKLSLTSLLMEYPLMSALAALLVGLIALFTQLGPSLVSYAINHGLTPPHYDYGVVVAMALLYLVSIVVSGGAQWGQARVTGRLASWVMNDLRIKVFRHLQRLSLDFFTEEKAGVVMSRMTSDIENLQQLLQDGLAQFAIQGLTMVVITVFLFATNATLAAITVFAVLPPLVIMSLWFKRASERGYDKVRDGIALVLADLSESLQGVRIVTAHNRQRYNVETHRDIVGSYRDANNYTGRINGVYGPGSQVISVFGQVLILGIGGAMYLHHPQEINLGQLTAFFLYVNRFFSPIQLLVQQYNTFQQGRASVFKLQGLLENEPSVLEARDAVELPQIRGEIRFDHVSFGYDPAVPVLFDVDLTIAPGETVAFVGATGAGKSTMAKLVTRFYDPTEGRVLIDGFDLAHVTLSSLRSQLGVVPQEPFLFAGTIRDNIAFARPGAPDDEVWNAVHQVGLGELVHRLPYGLDTPVHERGQSLSSGERQLIALGRAFMAEPRVLVLDEATSNLDLKSETMVEAALDVLLEGRTAVLIAHRLSTAMRADRIVVVGDGRLLEVGSHSELVALGGHYAEMYQTWITQSHTA